MNKVPTMLTEGESQLDHMCRLSFNEPVKHKRLTTIIATIGRSSRNVDKLHEMIRSGMDIARLNFSHESHECHAESIEMLKQAVERCTNEQGYNHHVGIALDTKGPEIRTGFIEGGSNAEIELKKPDNIRLSINRDLMDKGTKECVYVDYPNIINVVLPGNRVFVNDGLIVLVVKEVAVDCVICEIETGGVLGSRKGVKLPGVPVDLPPVSEKDRYDLKFGVDHNVDFIFASAIRNAAAIKEIRKVLGDKGKGIKVVAKIENVQAMQNLNEIISASDAILLERSDLGVEMPPEKVFLVQKAVIARCNKAGKPVICAAKLLETLITKPHPTRAEISDLGNAVLDGADCVMLSSESAIGPYALEAVRTMDTIVREAECALWYHNFFDELLALNSAAVDAVHAVAISAVDAARKSLASAIIAITTSGRSATLLSKYRPRCPILAVTRCSRVARQAYLHRGIVPLLYTERPNDDWIKEIDTRVQYALFVGKRMGIVNVGDAVVILSTWKDGLGFTNNMRIVYAYFEHETVDCLLTKGSKKNEKVSE